MSNFTVTLTELDISASYWGWWLTFVLFCLAAFWVAVTSIEKARWGQGRYGGVAIALAFIAVFTVCVNMVAYPAIEEVHRESRIVAALAERGITDPIIPTEGSGDPWVLTRDLNTALYTVLGDGETVTFYQITE